MGTVGFFRFTSAVASASNDALLAAVSRSGVQGPPVTTATPVGLAALAPLAFALGTPLGWLASYLVLTGAGRGVAAAVGERRGDPLIALAFWSAARVRGGARSRDDSRRRERLEGPEVADRVVAAARLGISGAELVVVASRVKPEWTAGTVLDCGTRYFRVGAAEERTLPTGLRTLYPLHEIPEVEVFRRVVRYELKTPREPS